MKNIIFFLKDSHAAVHFLRTFLLLVVPMTLVMVVFATPPSSPYHPGETLDPGCAPFDTNCTVVAPSAYTENAVNFQTLDDTPSLLYSLPVDEDTAVHFKVGGITASSDVNNRFFFNFGGLFYRQTGGNVSQQDSTLNLGGPLGVFDAGSTNFFGDGTTEYDVTEEGGQPKFTWNAIGSSPSFVSNGLISGNTVEITGPGLPPQLMGSHEIFVVTEDSILLNSPGIGFEQVDMSGILISIFILDPTPNITLSANPATQTIDVLATGLSSTMINWNAGIQYLTVTAP